MSELFDHLFAPQEDSGHYYGVYIAVVTNTKDPEKRARVKLKLPWISPDQETGWARISSPMAGAGRGVYFLPEVNDEVLVMFAHGSPQHPIVIGSLWNGQDKPPLGNEDGKNDVRLIRSRSGHVIRLTDTDGAEKIEIVDKSGKTSITLDAAAKTLVLAADGDVTVRSTNGKVVLDGKDVEVKASSGVSVQANGSAKVTANGQLTLKGATVEIN